MCILVYEYIDFQLWQMPLKQVCSSCTEDSSVIEVFISVTIVFLCKL
jgi:hypothetical protein